MFEKLFKYPGVLRRHRDAPCTSEREGYLAHRAADGASLATLHRIARELLVIVHEMDLKPKTISVDAIESAAARWARRQKRCGRAGRLCWSHSLFVQVAHDWLRFLGRLEEPEDEAVPCATLIEDFASFLRSERGLSVVTIANYSWYVKRFLGWFHAQGNPLAEVSILDVDAFIRQHPSWSRVTSACCAKSLRAFFRHAERHDWCTRGIAAAIESPRIFKQEALPTGPAWGSVRELIASTDSECPRNIRDRAILMILGAFRDRRSHAAMS